MATTKYLDYDGLKTVWSKVKEKDESVLTSAKTYADTQVNTAKAELDTSISNVEEKILKGNIVAMSAQNAKNATNATNDSDGNKISTTYIKASQKGATNGVATLGADGRIPAAQLPSYVDDVIEGYYNSGKFYKEEAHTTEITGETGKIYVDLSTNITYRYTGNTEAPYCEISASLALGETASTAYSGASGKKNREDIDTLQSYFTNGKANYASSITDGTNTFNASQIKTIESNVNTISKNYVPEYTSSGSNSAIISNTLGYISICSYGDTLSSKIALEGSTLSIKGEEINIGEYSSNTKNVIISSHAGIQLKSYTLINLFTETLEINVSKQALIDNDLFIKKNLAIHAGNITDYVTAITADELTEILK